MCVTAKVAQFRDKIELKIVEIFDLVSFREFVFSYCFSYCLFSY